MSARGKLNDLSQAISVVSQALSVETANRVSAVNVVSNAVSVETSNRVSADNALSNLISALSAQLSLQISAISQAHSALSQALSNETSNRTSADNALSVRIDTQSQAISVLSQAHSVLSQAVSNEISNRTSADNALSVRIDTQSQAISVLSQQVSALSQAHSVLSQAVSNEASNRISADNALSVRIDTQSQSISVLSQQVSIISVQLVSVQSALSAETVNRTSADNVLSNVISAVQQLSLQNVDGSAVSAGTPVGGVFTSANTFKQVNASAAPARVIGLVVDNSIPVSAFGRVQTGGPLTLTTAQWDSITGQTGGLTPGSIYYTDLQIGRLTTAVTGTQTRIGIALSTTTMLLQIGFSSEYLITLLALISSVSVLSNQISIVSQAVSVETGNRISADNVLSNAISAVSQQLSLQVSALSQVISLMSNRLSNLSNRVSVLEQTPPGSASVTSNELSAASAAAQSAIDTVSNALSNETSNRISADNVLSNAISAVSQQLSLVASALSQAISVETVDRTSADNALSNAISAILLLSLQNVDASVVSAGAPVFAFTSANTFKQANQSGTGNLGKIIGLVVDGSIAISAFGHIAYDGPLTLTTAQWDSVAGTTGGLTPGTVYYADVTTGKITSTLNASAVRVGTALSPTTLMLQIGEGPDYTVLIAAIFQSLSTLSNQISVLSQQASVISAKTDTLSQQISVISQQISVISAGLGGMQMKVLGGNQTISVSTATNISGLSVSIAAGGVYQLQGMVMAVASIVTACGFGLSYPTLVQGTGRWWAMVSSNAGVAGPGSATQQYNIGVNEVNAATRSNSAVCSLTPQGSASPPMAAYFDYLIQASAAGTAAVMFKQAGGSPGFVILKGSFIRAYKLA